jgi:nucleoside-diphosphate-sugar epimerase
VIVVRVFVAGGTGVLGRRLVPQLVARGHQVTATTTSSAKLGLVAELGADGVVMNGLDAVSVKEAVAAARPDAIVHEMTALSLARTGRPSLRHPDRWIATTTRLRTEGTDHLLDAAEASGVSHIVAQSVAGSFGNPKSGWVTEVEPQPLEAMGPKMRQAAAALRHVEDVVVKAGGAALRYGALYGPGATDDIVKLVRKRFFPLVGGGTGYSRGCISTTRRALRSLRWSRRRRACSISSATSRRWSKIGCRISRSAPGRSRRGGSLGGWSAWQAAIWP